MKKKAKLLLLGCALGGVAAMSAISMSNEPAPASNGMPIEISVDGVPVSFPGYGVPVSVPLFTTNGVPISISTDGVPGMLTINHGVPISVRKPDVPPTITNISQDDVPFIVATTNGVPISISASETTTVYDYEGDPVAISGDGTPTPVPSDLTPILAATNGVPISISTGTAPAIITSLGEPIVLDVGDPADFRDYPSDIVEVVLVKDPNHIDAETAGFKMSFTETPGQLELVMQLEDEFETSIPDEEAEKIRQVGQQVDFIVSHAKQ